jgi:hypothetical protein
MIKKLLICSVTTLCLLPTTSSYGSDKKYSVGVVINGFIPGINARTAIADNLFIGAGIVRLNIEDLESNDSYS